MSLPALPDKIIKERVIPDLSLNAIANPSPRYRRLITEHYSLDKPLEEAVANVRNEKIVGVAEAKIAYNHYNNFDLIKSAIRNNSLEAVRYLVEEVGVEPTIDDMLLAVEEGRLYIVKYLERYVELPEEALNIATRRGHLVMFQYFVMGKKMKPTEETLLTAIRVNQLPIVKDIVEYANVSPTWGSMVIATRLGKLSILKYLLERTQPSEELIEELIEVAEEEEKADQEENSEVKEHLLAVRRKL